MRLNDRVTLEESLTAAGDRLAQGCATAEDVAARLKTAQCEGKRGNPLRCPLARWYRASLREQGLLPRRRVLSVDGATWGLPYLYVHVRRAAGRGPDLCPPVPVPGVLAQFASGFDSGGFTELSA